VRLPRRSRIDLVGRGRSRRRARRLPCLMGADLSEGIRRGTDSRGPSRKRGRPMSTTSRDVVAEPLIRNLTFADLPAILEIERMSFSTPWRESTFVGLLRRTDSDLLGATRVGRLVGYCVCWTVGDQAELGNVAVSPQERGRGTGTRLVQAGLARVKERGARECYLEVRESNHTA